MSSVMSIEPAQPERIRDSSKYRLEWRNAGSATNSWESETLFQSRQAAMLEAQARADANPHRTYRVVEETVAWYELGTYRSKG